jgi:hypothetical protein
MVVAAFTISVIALVLAMIALPPVFQMVWGRPNVDVIFSDSKDESNQRKYLHCQIVNLPLENRLLQKLGVYRRPIDDVHAFFSVEDIKTHKIVVIDIMASIYTTQNAEQMISVSLPASTIPALINLVEARNDGYTNTIAHYEAKNIKLPVGEYRAFIRVKTSEKEREFRRNFFVGNKQEDLHWDSA